MSIVWTELDWLTSRWLAHRFGLHHGIACRGRVECVPTGDTRRIRGPLNWWRY